MRKRTYKLKYPKLLLLLLSFVPAYFLFADRNLESVQTILLSAGYFGTFVAGAFFSYGFTAAPATAVLLALSKQQSIVWAGIIGGLGALIGDLFIFEFIRHSFADEIKKLSKERMINHFRHGLPKRLKEYVIPVVAGFIIASPLPDEIGVSMLAASRNISIKAFSIFSYVLNTAGIFAILIIGTAL